MASNESGNRKKTRKSVSNYFVQKQTCARRNILLVVKNTSVEIEYCEYVKNHAILKLKMLKTKTKYTCFWMLFIKLVPNKIIISLQRQI